MLSKPKLLVSLLKVVDLAVIAVSIGVAGILTAALTADDNFRILQMVFSVPQILGGLAYLGFVHFVLTSRGLYESYRFAATARESHDVAIAVLVAATVLLPFATMARP